MFSKETSLEKTLDRKTSVVASTMSQINLFLFWSASDVFSAISLYSALLYPSQFVFLLDLFAAKDKIDFLSLFTKK